MRQTSGPAHIAHLFAGITARLLLGLGTIAASTIAFVGFAVPDLRPHFMLVADVVDGLPVRPQPFSEDVMILQPGPL